MLPNEAWLCIMKGLGRERVEFKTGSNMLNEIQKTYFAEFYFDRVVFTSIDGMLGYEPIDEPIEVDYNEFASVFPMYFSKLRFSEGNSPMLKNSKYIFPLIKKYVVDAVNDSGNMIDMSEINKENKEETFDSILLVMFLKYKIALLYKPSITHQALF